MSSFKDYRSARRRKGGKCAICDGEGEGRVAVTLQERRAHPDRTAKHANKNDFPSIASRSATYCEKHAIEIFEAAVSVVQGSQP